MRTDCSWKDCVWFKSTKSIAYKSTRGAAGAQLQLEFSHTQSLCRHLWNDHAGQDNVKGARFVCRWADCRTARVKSDETPIRLHLAGHANHRPSRCAIEIEKPGGGVKRCGAIFLTEQERNAHINDDHEDSSSESDPSVEDMVPQKSSSPARPAAAGVKRGWEAMGLSSESRAIDAKRLQLMNSGRAASSTIASGPSPTAGTTAAHPPAAGTASEPGPSGSYVNVVAPEARSETPETPAPSGWDSDSTEVRPTELWKDVAETDAQLRHTRRRLDLALALIGRHPSIQAEWESIDTHDGGAEGASSPAADDGNGPPISSKKNAWQQFSLGK